MSVLPACVCVCVYNVGPHFIQNLTENTDYVYNRHILHCIRFKKCRKIAFLLAHFPIPAFFQGSILLKWLSCPNFSLYLLKCFSAPDHSEQSGPLWQYIWDFPWPLPWPRYITKMTSERIVSTNVTMFPWPTPDNDVIMVLLGFVFCCHCFGFCLDKSCAPELWAQEFFVVIDYSQSLAKIKDYYLADRKSVV